MSTNFDSDGGLIATRNDGDIFNMAGDSFNDAKNSKSSNPHMSPLTHTKSGLSEVLGGSTRLSNINTEDNFVRSTSPCLEEVLQNTHGDENATNNADSIGMWGMSLPSRIMNKLPNRMSLPAAFSSMLGDNHETNNGKSTAEDYEDDGELKMLSSMSPEEIDSDSLSPSQQSEGRDRSSNRVPDYISKTKSVVDNPHHLQAQVNFQRDIITEKDEKINQLRAKLKILKRATKQLVNNKNSLLSSNPKNPNAGEAGSQEIRKELKASKILLMAKENRIQEMAKHLEQVNDMLKQKEESQHLLVKKNIELQQDLYRERQFIKRWERTRAKLNQKPTVKNSLWGSGLDVVFGSSTKKEEDPEILRILARHREKNNSLKGQLRKKDETISEIQRRYEKMKDRNRDDHRAMMEMKATMNELENKCKAITSASVSQVAEMEAKQKQETEALRQEIERMEARHKEDTVDLEHEHQAEIRSWQERIQKLQHDQIANQRRLVASHQIEKEELRQEIDKANTAALSAQEMLEALQEAMEVQKSTDQSRLQNKEQQLQDTSEKLKKTLQSLEESRGRVEKTEKALEESRVELKRTTNKLTEVQEEAQVLSSSARIAGEKAESLSNEKMRSIAVMRALCTIKLNKLKRSELKIRVDLLRQVKERCKEQVMACHDEALGKETAKAEQRIKSLKEALEEKEEELQKALGASKDHEENLRQVRSESNATLSEKDKDISLVNSKLRASMSECNALRSEVDRLKQAILEEKETLDNSQKSLAESMVQIEAMEKNDESKRETITSLEKEIRTKEAETEQMICESRASEATLRQSLDASEKRGKELHTRLNEAMVSIGKMKKDMDQQCKLSDSLTQRNKAMEVELEFKTRENERMTREMKAVCEGNAGLVEKLGLEREVAIRSQFETERKTLEDKIAALAAKISQTDFIAEKRSSKFRSLSISLEEQLANFEKLQAQKNHEMSLKHKKSLEDVKMATAELEQERQSLKNKLLTLAEERSRIKEEEHKRAQAHFREEMSRMRSRMQEEIAKNQGASGFPGGMADQERMQLMEMFQQEKKRLDAESEALLKAQHDKAVEQISALKKLNGKLRESAKRWRDRARSGSQNTSDVQDFAEEDNDLDNVEKDSTFIMREVKNEEKSKSQNKQNRTKKTLTISAASEGTTKAPLRIANDDDQSQRKKGKMCTEDAKRKLEALFRKYNPNKLGNVDRLLKKFKGREKELLQAVQSKYESKKNSHGKNPGWLGLGEIGGAGLNVVSSGLNNMSSGLNNIFSLNSGSGNNQQQ